MEAPLNRKKGGGVVFQSISRSIICAVTRGASCLMMDGRGCGFITGVVCSATNRNESERDESPKPAYPHCHKFPATASFPIGWRQRDDYE